MPPAAKRSAAGLFLSLAVLALSAGLLCGPWRPGTERVREQVLAGPFESVGGHAYRAPAPPHVAGSGLGRLHNSRLKLLENGQPLGPPDADTTRVMQVGEGAFHHWGQELFFSTRDNSDPNRNDRVYSARWPESWSAAWYLLAACAGYVALLFAIHQLTGGVGSRLAGLARVVANLAAMTALVETSAWSLTRTDLSRAGAQAGRVFDAVFAHRPFESFGASAFYQEHHYLNYALAANALESSGQRAFDPVYHIRRHEPLRRRGDVKFRLLILGGSTTYGEGVEREADTWVAQLERRLREQFGPACDVINGGVGGYTVYDNLIHYATLLTHLQPDVVLLCVGLNDVHPRLYADPAPDHAHYRQPWRAENQTLPPLDPRWEKLWSYRCWYTRCFIANADLSNILRLVTRQPYPDSSLWRERLAENSSDLYRENLANLIRLIAAQGRRVAVVPQYYAPRASEDEIFGGAVREHNEIGQRLAEELRVPWCGAAAAAETFDAADTWDQCHFYGPGSAKMAECVWSFLVAEQLLPGEVAAAP